MVKSHVQIYIKKLKLSKNICIYTKYIYLMRESFYTINVKKKMNYETVISITQIPRVMI